MKRNILTILLMTLALHLSARMYVPGEDIYVNTNQTAFNVSGSNYMVHQRYLYCAAGRHPFMVRPRHRGSQVSYRHRWKLE